MYSTGENDPNDNTICNNLFDHKRDWYILWEYYEWISLVYEPPPLHKVCLTEPDR